MPDDTRTRAIEAAAKAIYGFAGRENDEWDDYIGVAIAAIDAAEEAVLLGPSNLDRHATPIATHGLGAGWPIVRGICPACRLRSLFVGGGGHVTCASLECADPTAADRLLHAEESTDG